MSGLMGVTRAEAIRQMINVALGKDSGEGARGMIERAMKDG
jgi:hypothetical protein